MDKTPEDIEEEGQLLDELLDVVEQRNALVAMLEEERLRYSSVWWSWNHIGGEPGIWSHTVSLKAEKGIRQKVRHL